MLGQMRLPRTEGTEASSRFLFFRDLINNIGGKLLFFTQSIIMPQGPKRGVLPLPQNFQSYEIKIYF
ncbi:hypothetical protein BARVI_04640 [Barnesiella viscericola DSM 18177]|uniref:Uncharacterized protein n=1 Tax=Barnesiella viscericola DSM 18177 TaxID=880074 RepID=W0ESJ0_9BACT|nr:hypothetical protein BARVI_04640 [Barnesiella viscericola DSM 18177]